MNLINSMSASQDFWDGGVWGSRNDNWTGLPDYPINGHWNSDQFAIFGGTVGAVTIDNSQGMVAASGMQFIIDGYSLVGDQPTLAASVEATDQRQSSGSVMNFWMTSIRPRSYLQSWLVLMDGQNKCSPTHFDGC